jgi:hypothetical protein
MDTIIDLDDGNAVAIQAHKLEPNACPRGFLGGKWGRDIDGNRIFFGRWMTANGALAGHLQGTWGIEEDGIIRNIFYGKYIDINGNFEGVLKGVYGAGFGPNALAMNGRVGFFRGYFYDANGNILGVLGGKYGRAPEPGYGLFYGRWKTICPGFGVNTEPDGLE